MEGIRSGGKNDTVDIIVRLETHIIHQQMISLEKRAIEVQHTQLQLFGIPTGSDGFGLAYLDAGRDEM